MWDSYVSQMHAGCCMKNPKLAADTSSQQSWTTLGRLVVSLLLWVWDCLGTCSNKLWLMPESVKVMGSDELSEGIASRIAECNILDDVQFMHGSAWRMLDAHNHTTSPGLPMEIYHGKILSDGFMIAASLVFVKMTGGADPCPWSCSA